MDEQQRQRIRDDLHGFFRGELLFDDLSRALYSTDASIFEVRPLGVAVPRDEEDVQALVRYAAENRLPLVARGAGSGVAGEALGPGLILDLSRHFRSILGVSSDTIHVQAGVTCREINSRLAHDGRRFAPDPASAEQCTVGGMVANNASGAHSLRYGYTRDHVAALRVVLDSGDTALVGKEPLQPPSPYPLPLGGGEGRVRGAGSPGHLQDIVGATAVLLEENAELIRSCRPRTPYNRCGYLLHDVLAEGTLDLAKLLTGSEGTLALVTEATLRTLPIPGGRSLVLLGFASLDTALRVAQRALATGPAACELLDRRLLSLARGSGAAHVAALVPPAAEAVLLIEYETDVQREAREAALQLAEQMYRRERLALCAAPAVEPEEIARLWRLREVALPSLYGLRGGSQPVPLIEDVGVPVEELAAYLHRVQEILKEHETTASFLVHAGTGQVHTRPFLDLRRPGDVSKLTAIAEEVHALALQLGGTVSTQHGTGLARTPWVARQYGPLYPVFRQLKAIFDPRGLFNPGKIVDPGSEVSRWPLRRIPTPTEPDAPWLLRWQADEVRGEALSCNGCGQCRTTSPGQRMCPIFRATHAEAASPRAKANLLRHLLAEKSDPRQLAPDEVRAVADLCVNCRMCAVECPAHVNIPRLMLEAKAANVAEYDLDWKDWFLARIEPVARLASTFSLVVNLALRSRLARWLLEKLFGVSRRRRLPRFALRSFLRQARRRSWTRKPPAGRPRVAYFVDVFANCNDPQIGEATVTVLNHNDIAVYVPPGQRGCGMAALAHGDVEAAREIVRHNLRALGDVAREGWPIVCSEPTAALMLRQDYPDLTDDPDAKLVSERAVELTTFLLDLHRQGKLRTDFEPLDFAVGHHVPCHVKALGQPPAGPALLSLIPSLTVHTIDVSCSGMAGTFGLKDENYQTSLEAGRPMLEELKRPRVLFGSTECSTCRMQMEDGAGTRTLHPIQYLALAYGLLPEVARRLQEPIRELVLR
ncbi:MAG: anaerobic glycerol-3-phosphate dehydrogenase subunit C [Gemmataceae bacterium]|nr:anaerobic glycerol-3-phosphate dehydrogenase subunit C [Gemmataceae bacterium]